jgi:hypothetical protein
VQLTVAFLFFPHNSRISSMIPLVRIARMSTAAIVRAPVSTPGIAGEVCNGLERELADVGIKTLQTHFVDYTAGVPTDAQRANYTRIGEFIMQQQPDVVFTCLFSPDPTDAMASLWKNSSWAPKMAVLGTDGAVNDISVLDYWIGTDLVRFLSAFLRFELLD